MDKFNRIWTSVLLTLLAGISLGLFLLLENPTTLGMIAYIVIFMAMIAATFIFHIIAHEGGHCIGGLLSGYRFESFRVFSIMIVKQNGKLLRKKFHLAGTGGQCLMAPPQPFRPDFPYRMYNLAGGLTNLLIAVAAILLCIPVVNAGGILDWLLLVLLPLFVSGVYCGVTNLVPMTISGICNDGWNLRHLGKDAESRRIFWLLLEVMARINRGAQFRDMPEEWFFEQRDETPDYGNSFQCGLGVFRFNYLLDTGKFPQAAALADQILATGKRVPQLYRYELLCESVFLELIGEGRLDKVEKLYTPELQRYVKATDSYPHRQRLHYAMALLYFHDEEAAAKALEKFQEACRSYPNMGEILSEWELMGLVDCKLAELKALASGSGLEEDSLEEDLKSE
jgi:hypothetical protein